MKIIKAYGGLGNQMFQYAFYKYLSLYNNDVKFDIRDYKIHNYHQGFELKEIFNVDFVEPTKSEIKKLAVSQESLIVRGLFRMFGLRISRTSEIFEQKDLMFINNNFTTADAVLRGNWQDKSYIEPIEDELKNIFSFPEINEINKRIANNIQENNSVSIHIRRGDYLKSSSLYGICDETYYNNAINLMLCRLGDCKFYFFSDDIEWCKNKYPSLNAEYIAWNHGEESYRDMQLMSLCRHNIIANSTFSWWGAWLNKYINKIVILPKMWEKNRSSKKLQYKNWIEI